MMQRLSWRFVVINCIQKKLLYNYYDKITQPFDEGNKIWEWRNIKNVKKIINHNSGTAKTKHDIALSINEIFSYVIKIENHSMRLFSA